MRNLILLCGGIGVGKSTWVKENNLSQYTISPDLIRLMVQSPVLTTEGRETITQKNDKRVWSLLFEILEDRMSRGELTIIDATHSRSKLINRYRELVRKYRYRVTVVDFDKPLDTILKQNRTRESYKFVNEEQVKMVYERLKTEKIPSWCNVIAPDEWESFTKIKYDFTDKFNKIVVFGDIHSNVLPLKKYFNENPINSDTFYIFVGDYFDRGTQPVDTFKFFQELMTNSNMLFLTGNHETWLFEYIQGNHIKSEKARKTFIAFEEAGITLREIKDFYNKLGQLAYFKYHNNTFVVTHGGLPVLPTMFTATKEMIYGVGKYEDSNDVDIAFCNNTPENHYSIHGHRNIFKESVSNTHKTFNVCTDTEYSGVLRYVDITRDSILGNSIIDCSNIAVKERDFYPTKNILKLTGNQAIDMLNKNKNVVKKDLGDNIFSYNFSRKVFTKKQWNNETIKARGLFIDNDLKQIVARSYDKFFNVGERKESRKAELPNFFTYPVSVYEKYNGFLGIVSVHKGEWFIASKSTNKGEHSKKVEELTLPYRTDKLKAYVENKKVSLVFEVIDTDFDPHIISYDEPKVILLDIIYNDFDFKKVSYVDLCKIAKEFNLLVKDLVYTLNESADLLNLIHNVYSRDNFTTDIEGYVLEGSNNEMLKIKTPYYNFWKNMRGIKTALVHKGGDHTEIRNKLHSLDEFTIYNALLTLDMEFLNSASILEIRKKLVDLNIVK